MAKQTKIENVIATRYDVDALECSALTVCWAAEHMADTVGEDVAEAEWARLNRRRERAGRCTTSPTYGSKLWAAFCRRLDARKARREANAA
jgi:hypothetical protein